MGVGDVEMDIDRAHKIGKPTINNKTGVLEQQVLIKFRSWQARTKVYRARPRGNKATRSGKFSVCLDLTKRRQALLSLARDLIANRPQFAYAFADINCNFGLKMAFGDFLKPKRSCVSANLLPGCGYNHIKLPFVVSIESDKLRSCYFLLLYLISDKPAKN